MTSHQRKLFNGLKKIMENTITTNVAYGTYIKIKDIEGKEHKFITSQYSGALTILAGENQNFSSNTILISPDDQDIEVNKVTDAYYKLPIDPENGARLIPINIHINSTDKLFHELGHVIFEKQSQDLVIDYNNHARRILKLKLRPYDEYHNYTKF